MARGFPPQPVYPDAIDSDFTLYLVHNTTESILTADNSPWTEEIPIVPVGINDAEIWADNGFGNIDGELFYYDSVAKDSNGKVTTLTNCVRNLGGTQTKYVTAGAVIRGFVVAQHHNQLVEAICRIEKFVGYNFDPNTETLDYRIRCLREVPICPDDFGCPDVIFELNIEETNNDGCIGIRVEYSVEVDGEFNNFRIDFGDGTSTTSVASGVHVYPINQTIDPVVTVTSNNCQIVQTPISRTNPIQPSQVTDEPFEISIPEFDPIPPFSCTPIVVPDPDLVVPPFSLPCVDFNSTAFPSIVINIPSTLFIPSLINFGPLPEIPSTITFIDAPTFSPIGFGPAPTFSPIGFGPINIPSQIDFGPAPTFSPIGFGPVNIPSQINFGPAPSFSPIDFGPVNIPSQITFSPVNIPSQIDINWAPVPSFDPIQFGPAPDIMVQWGPAPEVLTTIEFAPTPSIDPIQFGPAPTVLVDWGPTPTLVLTVDCPSSTPAFRAANVDSINVDSLDSNDDFMSLDVSSLLPSTINLEVPKDFPRSIDLIAPTSIELKVPEDFPKTIDVIAPKFEDIKIIGPDIPIPSEINVNATGIPDFITLDAKSLPEYITLNLPEEFRTIKLDASSLPSSIQVVGMPNSIELKHNLPSEIQLVMPDNPKVEMVYEGAPIELKIKLDIEKSLRDGDDENPCVMIVPCNKK